MELLLFRPAQNHETRVHRLILWLVLAVAVGSAGMYRIYAAISYNGIMLGLACGFLAAFCAFMAVCSAIDIMDG